MYVKLSEWVRGVILSWNKLFLSLYTNPIWLSAAILDFEKSAFRRQKNVHYHDLSMEIYLLDKDRCLWCVILAI